MLGGSNVTIVVPAWNAESTIEEAVQSLLRQDYTAGRVQIIVVDNGSTDKTLEILKSFPDVQIVHEAKAGSYAARNAGIKQAKGELIAFTDSDCVADDKWISNAVDRLKRDPTIGIVAGRVELIPSPKGSRLVYLIESELSFRQKETVLQGRCATANWVSALKLIQDAGGFDDRLKSGGDWLLSGKLSSAGHSVVYEESAIVRHQSRERLLDLLQKRRRVTGGLWMRRRTSLLRLIGAEVKACVRRSNLIVGSNGLDAWDKVLVFPIVLVMSIVSIGELLRLQAGGAPRRA